MMRRGFGGIALAVCVLLTVAGGVARADDGLKDQVKELTDKAAKSYNAGHYQDALDSYLQADALLPLPALLFDIGQCHMKLKNYERAIYYYEEYLKEAPPESEHRKLAEELLEESKKAQANPNGPAPGDGETPPGLTPQNNPPPPQPPPPPPPQPQEGMAARWRLFLYGGGGVAVVGLGVLVGGFVESARVSSISSDLVNAANNGATWSPAYASKYNDGQSAVTAERVLYPIGAVLLVAGGVAAWYGWHLRGIASHVAVAPQPGGASMSLTWVY